MLGFTAILDNAKAGDRILLASYGSGAGCDAFSFVVTDLIEQRQALAPSTQDYISRRKPIDYALYARYRKKLQMG
jgi:hydroxymethylglutaryl-CoA synthase